MGMRSTVSVHWNPGYVVRAHNLREEDLCSREEHIDLFNEHGDSYHMTLINKELKEVYEEIFGEALEKYNEKQTRRDRRMTIEQYIQSVEADTRGKRQTRIKNGKRVVDESATRRGKQTSYEITVKVGNTLRAKDKDGCVIYDHNDMHVRPEELPRELQRTILLRYVDKFEEENPNFRIASLSIHADEGFYNARGKWQYSEIHSHIEVVPFASGFKTGLETQNSMNKAMRAMGFGTPDCYELWAKKEQARLEEITLDEYAKYCRTHPDYGKRHGELSIYHPVSEKRRTGDKSKEQFAREQELEEDLADVERLKAEYESKLADLACRNEELQKQKAHINKNRAVIEEQQNRIIQIETECRKKIQDTDTYITRRMREIEVCAERKRREADELLKKQRETAETQLIQTRQQSRDSTESEREKKRAERHDGKRRKIVPYENLVVHDVRRSKGMSHNPGMHIAKTRPVIDIPDSAVTGKEGASR